MYYHPRMFDWANGERTLAARQACLGVWLDGVARQQQPHAEAVGMFCARQMDSVRMVSEARDTAQFAARLLSCAAREPRGLAELSARLAEIVGDTHRKVGELLSLHGDQVPRSFVEFGAPLKKRHKNAVNRGGVARRRAPA
jgi:hypothetical protein